MKAIGPKPVFEKGGWRSQRTADPQTMIRSRGNPLAEIEVSSFLMGSVRQNFHIDWMSEGSTKRSMELKQLTKHLRNRRDSRGCRVVREAHRRFSHLARKFTVSQSFCSPEKQRRLETWMFRLF